MAIASAICALLQDHREWLALGVVLSVGYVIWILIRTWRLVRNPESLGTFDKWISQRSGLVGPLPGSILLAGLIWLEKLGYNPEHYFFSARSGWFIFQFLSEVGLVMGFACIVAPRRSGLFTAPFWFWKIFNVPFFLLHIVYVIGSLTYGFGTSRGPV